MSLWGSIKGIGKKVLGGIGDVAKFAAPVASFIPGVGPLAAGAMGLGGGLLGQLNDEDPSLGAGLKQGLISGGAAYGLGKLGGGGSSFLGNAGNAIKGVGKQVLGGGMPGMGTSALAGGLGGLAMGGVNAFMNAQDATRYRGIEDEQIGYAKDQRARQQEMEDKILGNINPALNVPDLGNIFEDTSNPFYKPFPASQAPVTPLGGGTTGGIPSVPGLPPEMPQDPAPIQRGLPSQGQMDRQLALQELQNRGGIKGIQARMTY